MSRKPYNWSNGPAIIEQHSIAKHTILQNYLAAYFKTLASNPSRKEFRLTLVDGFAGGGLYRHALDKSLVYGSPLICINAVKEAKFFINRDRRIPLHFDVSFFFIEAERTAYQHLMSVLDREGYTPEIGINIHVRHTKFHDDAVDLNP